MEIFCYLKSIQCLGFIGMFAVANSQPSSRKEEYFAKCEAECSDSEFCGIDEQCHAYSCENWFVHGPAIFTLRNRLDEKERNPLDHLTCRPLSAKRSDTEFWGHRPRCEAGLPLAAVLYNASEIAHPEYSMNWYCPDQPGQVATLPFDRKCTAHVDVNDKKEAFVCYDITSNEAVLKYQKAVVDQSAELLLTNSSNSTDSSSSLTHYSRMTMLGPVSENDIVIVGFGYSDKLPLKDDPFPTERVAAAMASEHVIIQGTNFPFCDPEGCPVGTFCGNDGSCHKVGDCETFYKYAPVNRTGRISSDAPSLNCTGDYQTEFDVDICSKYNYKMQTLERQWPLAVSYVCREGRWDTSSVACPSNYTAGRELPFNRMCTAEPNPYQEYVCFDTIGMEEMSILKYEEAVLKNNLCTVENFDSSSPAARAKRSNWTTCKDPSSVENCFLAGHKYANEMRRSIGTRTVSTFVRPYGGTRFPLFEPAPDGNVIDRQWLSYAMASYLSGDLPVETNPSDSDDESAATSRVPWFGAAAFLLSVTMTILFHS